MRIFLLLILAANAVLLRAGVRMKGETRELKSGDVIQQEILLEPERMRINIKSPGADVSMIFLASGPESRMIILDRSKNEFRVLDQKTMSDLQQKLQGAMAMMQEQLKNMTPEQRARMEKMMGRMGQMQAQAAQKVTYTAKGSGAVNGLPCTRYEGVSNGQRVAELCAAEAGQLGISPGDLQVFDKVRQFFAEFSKSLANIPLASGVMNQFADSGFPGYPVEYTAFRDGQVVYKAETKSVERVSLSDADFSTGNARQLETPFGPSRAR